MKKIVPLLLIIALAVGVPLPAFASGYTSTPNIQIHKFYYDSGRDQYILDYTFRGYANALITIFYSDNGQTYTKSWGRWSINRQILHNCNGIFNYDFSVNGEVVGTIRNLVTDSIQDEVCSQQIPGESEYDINPRITDGDGGKRRINYDEINGGSDYTLQRSLDGGQTWQTVGTNTDGSGTSGYFDVTNGGYYRIVVKDQNGNTITEDYIGESEFDNSKCDGCRTLQEMLACPAWEQYIGDLADAIGGSIPAPPDINDGMDYLIDKLAEQEVEPTQPTAPEPFNPGYEEQQIDLPEPVQADINPPETVFEPVTGGEGSGAIEITDPLDVQFDEEVPAYEPPDTEGETPPPYSPPNTTPEPAPPYQVTDGAGEIPDYNYGDDGGGTIPEYNAGDGGAMPNYQYGNGNNSGIPQYQYGN